MNQFKYVDEMNSLMSMEGPIMKGPPPRWQKKGLENSSSNMNISLNSSTRQKSFNTTASTSLSKTPTKRLGTDVIRTKKTPSKTPSKSKSPGRSTSPTPNKGAKTPNGGDRFIPVRTASNFDLGHFQVCTCFT